MNHKCEEKKYDYLWKNDGKLANSLHFSINLVSSLAKKGIKVCENMVFL